MEEGRRARRGRVTPALVGVAVAIGCRGGTPAARPPLGKALTAALSAADRARTPWRCAALDTPQAASQTVKGWQLDGATLTLPVTQDLTIGVVADAGGAAPETIAALTRLRAKLDAASPALVLTLGGMGGSEAELTATLGTLADRAAYPVVALAGDLEPEPAQLAALAALHARGADVLDGRIVRWIEAGGATIATIPGAGAAERLLAGADGCGWLDADLGQVAAKLGERPGLRIAASAEAPRAVIDGEPTGELALALPNIDVALHGAGVLSQARSGHRDASAVPLSPGSTDATARLPAHVVSAGLIAIRNGSWSWTPLVDTR